MQGQNVIDINMPNIITITIIWFLGVAALGAIVMGCRSLMGANAQQVAG